MAKIFRKTHNPYAPCAITHSLTLMQYQLLQDTKKNTYARLENPELKFRPSLLPLSQEHGDTTTGKYVLMYFAYNSYMTYPLMYMV